MRAALRAVAVCLLLGVVTWNVVFDRAIQSAEQRYLAQQRPRAQSATIRRVMDPAIHDATRTATAWASAVTGAALIAALGARRVRTRRRSAHQPAPRV